MHEPRVTILLATYNPNISWLTAQLESLNKQTYRNLSLLVCDDCSSSVGINEIAHILDKCITRFPFRLLRNEANIGSNKTFERLTQEAEGDLFAYCDQDDIWEEDKISILVEAMHENNALLAYSDMAIIDGDGNTVSDSITKVRKRFHYYEGYDLWQRILIRNFISGCCMLIHAEAAKSAIPFELGMQHDRWLAVCASVKGYIAYVNKPLVQYRQHGMNQTGILKDISDKQSYREKRLIKHLAMLESIRARFLSHQAITSFLDEYIQQVTIRYDYSTGKRSTLIKMLRLISSNWSTVTFELIGFKLSDRLFKKLIELVIKRNL